MAQPSPHHHTDGDDNGNPMFHDFFVSRSPLLQNQILNSQLKLQQPSETHTRNHLLGVPIHGQNSEFSGPEVSDSSRFLGRKRNNPDLVFMGMPTETMSPIGAETFQPKKIHRDSSGVDHPRMFHPGELSSGMQPPKPISTSNHILRSESVTSEWGSSMMNVGPSTQYSSRQRHLADYVNKASTRDSHAGPSVLSSSAADAGSRTGIRGSGVPSAINMPPQVVIRSYRPSSGPESSDHESYDSLRQPGSDSACRQMTIFYAGQAHVFDQVHPNKADVILSLAGSEGGSWSTTYSPECSTHVRHEKHILNRENQQVVSSGAYPRHILGKLPMPRSSSHRVQISTTSGSMTSRSARSFHQRENSPRLTKEGK